MENPAVPIPMMEPKDVLRYLRSRLPNFIHLFSDPENLDPEVTEPYSSCTLLAQEIIRCQDDASLVESFCSVINEMAESCEFWMRETLGDLLEDLPHDEAFVAKLHPTSVLRLGKDWKPQRASPTDLPTRS